ncbi:MAG: Grx4 family monothiol glutaredoxin [Kofleriaceae bacterium]|nr:Grx4 family monothiol glutaredoxin [Kofleriaceae bacterium]MBP9166003.1 Grx4 family monothiol glutaredoxin [Kofleriaceae bacterium]MBP9857318.1 Grx4 family monothiol glutaredoxin [Kofleriaceae bacterium]
MSLAPELRQKIESMIASDAVVLFMKGSRSFPQCGFSAAVVQILDSMVPNYTTVNVLADPAIRDGIKAFSDWPTIPQLYVKGEFVGGSDIVRQMHASGELAGKLGDLAAPAAPPSVTVTARAAEILRGALADAGPGEVIHLSVDARYEHGLDVGPREPGAATVESNGITVQVDAASARRAAGVVIDYVDGPSGAGFKIDNPNRPPAVRAIGPKELASLLAKGEVKELFDVRTPRERATATIAGSVLLDDEVAARIATLDKATPLAFFCHHGGRSQNAAEHFLQQGFRTVYNLAGGIDAWAVQVDPSLPRY